MATYPSDPFLVYKRLGTKDSPFVQYNSPIRVTNGKVYLTEIPNKTNHVTVSDGTTSYAEMTSQASLSANNNYYVDYENGVVYFDPSHNDKLLTFSFLGEGIVSIPASRIYTQSSNGTPTQDLQDMIDNYNQLNGTDLYNLFDPQTGHKHSGAAGDAPPIDSQYVTYDNGLGTVSKVKDTLDSHAAQLADIVTLDVKQKGAKGDGTTDDTQAFIDLDNAISSAGNPVTVLIPHGTYIIDPTKFSNGKHAFQLIQDYSNVFCYGVVKIKSGVDYTVGRNIGDEWYFSLIDVKANHCTVNGAKLDGNGTATLKGYDSTIVNIRWEVVSALGVGDGATYNKGNKFYNCKGFNIGGQALSIQWQDQCDIENCYVIGSSGMGFSRCTNSSLLNNKAENSFDAPFYSNGLCENILIENNISTGTTNGSGIDVTGTRKAIIRGNSIKSSSAWGIHVGYNEDLGNISEEILIEGNILEDNAQVTNQLPCEILVGSPSTDRTVNAQNVTIKNNQFILNGSRGSFLGQLAKMGYGAANVNVEHNELFGTLSSSANVFTISEGSAKDIKFAHNRWKGTGNALVTVSSSYLGDFTVHDNDGITVDPNGSKFPNKGRFSSGKHEMMMVRNIPTTPTNVLSVSLPSGLTTAIIEVYTNMDGTAGAYAKRFVINGTSSSITIKSNTDIFAATDTNPPLITTDTSTAGTFKVLVAAQGVSRLTSLDVKVICSSAATVNFN